MTYQDLIRSSAEKWQAPFVARHEVGKFSGGVLNPRTLANLDCKGVGVEGGFKIGKKQVYPVNSLVDFMLKMAGAV